MVYNIIKFDIFEKYIYSVLKIRLIGTDVDLLGLMVGPSNWTDRLIS